MKMISYELYKVEVGVLLSKDNNEFNSYNADGNIYDKRYAYYDENVVWFLNKKDAIQYAKTYCKEGVKHTYAIVSALKQTWDDKEMFEYDIDTIKQQGYLEQYIDIFGSDCYDIQNVIDSCYKNEKCELTTLFGNVEEEYTKN